MILTLIGVHAHLATPIKSPLKPHLLQHPPAQVGRAILDPSPHPNACPQISLPENYFLGGLPLLSVTARTTRRGGSSHGRGQWAEGGGRTSCLYFISDFIKAAWKSLGPQFNYAGETGQASRGGDGETSAGLIYEGGFRTRHIMKSTCFTFLSVPMTGIPHFQSDIKSRFDFKRKQKPNVFATGEHTFKTLPRKSKHKITA